MLFPDHMKQLIDECAARLTAEFNPRNIVEYYLIWQMARGFVQYELTCDQVLVNLKFQIERVDLRWADDRREQAARAGARLHTAPCRIAGELGRSKYGALYLIDKLTSLGESIAANGGLDDQQRDYLFDLLGIDPVLRNGSARVPAGNNPAALAQVVEKEKARLARKIEVELDNRDKHEQDAARLGIFKYVDAETRRLINCRGRAERRFEWAEKTLRQIREGADPASILDPETKQPLNVAAEETPCPQAAPPPPPPPTPAAPPTAESPRTTIRLPRLPEGLRPDAREDLIDFLEMFVADFVARTVTITPDGDLGSLASD